MILIDNDQALAGFFREEAAVLFYDAAWSQYSVISKQMIKFVEQYAQMSEPSVRFFICCFEGDLVPLAKRVVSAGVPDHVFSGNGAASFFRCGNHLHTMRSVIGEGTYAVWDHLKQLRGVRS